jgi:hypothetical protein
MGRILGTDNNQRAADRNTGVAAALLTGLKHRPRKNRKIVFCHRTFFSKYRSRLEIQLNDSHKTITSNFMYWSVRSPSLSPSVSSFGVLRRTKCTSEKRRRYNRWRRIPEATVNKRSAEAGMATADLQTGYRPMSSYKQGLHRNNSSL